MVLENSTGRLYKRGTASATAKKPWICQLFSSSSSSGSRPGSFVNKCSPNLSSMSVTLLIEHHRRTLMKTRLIGKTFHQGRWYLLPRDWLTFHTPGPALLVENLMGASSTFRSSSVCFAAVCVLRDRGRILFSLEIKRILNAFDPSIIKTSI